MLDEWKLHRKVQCSKWIPLASHKTNILYPSLIGNVYNYWISGQSWPHLNKYDSDIVDKVSAEQDIFKQMSSNVYFDQLNTKVRIVFAIEILFWQAVLAAKLSPRNGLKAWFV